MEKHFTVGTRADNDIVYDHPSVSGRHVEITYDGSSRIGLRDLDSTNGTFVDEREVIKTSINRLNKLRLGKLRIDVQELFEQLNKLYHADKADYRREFEDLKSHFMTFERRKRRIKSKSSLAPNLLRGGFTLLSLAAILFFIEDPGLRYPLMIGAGVLGGLVVALGPTNKTAEKLDELRATYQPLLRCPNPACKQDLSGRHYRAWKAIKKCPQCEARFAD